MNTQSTTPGWITRFAAKMVLLFMLAAHHASGQDRIVNGKVTGVDDGLPLPGVNVVVMGSKAGTVTNSEGKFVLTLQPGETVLVFSFIGFQTETIQIGERSAIDVSLRTDVVQLSEVVVTALGMESEKKRLSSSISDVTGKELVGSTETNLVTSMAAKVPGLQITSAAGTPGAAAIIRIRGNKSINGNNSPLIVVDGIPINNWDWGYGGGVDESNRAIDINPNDVESVSILKGPGATALYGLRASNGAVVITTKKGRADQQRVVISSSAGIEEVNRLPAKQLTYAQGKPQFLSGAPSTENGVWWGPHTALNFSWGPRMSDLEFSEDINDIDGFGPGYAFDRNGVLGLKGQGSGIPAIAYDPYSFFIKGYKFDNSASVSGGGDRTAYFISAGHLYHTGVIPKSDFSRKTARVNLETAISKNLTVGMSGNYVQSGGNRVQKGSNTSGVMLDLLRNPPSFDIGNGKKGMDAASDPATYTLANGEQRSYNSGIYDNPYWTINKNQFRDNVNRVYGNTSLRYTPLRWLTFDYKIGGDHYSEFAQEARDINPFVSAGRVSEYVTVSTDINSDLLISANAMIARELSLSAVIGHNYFLQERRDQTMNGSELSAPGFFSLTNAATVNYFEQRVRRGISGIFANFNLGWKEGLFVNLTARNDWASTLPPDANSFFYPSAGVSLILSEFLWKDSKTVPFAKVWTSWGKVGNDPRPYVTNSYYSPYYVTGDGFTPGYPSPLFGFTAYESNSLRGNPFLRPEFTNTIEYGADIRLFRERLSLEVAHYASVTGDAIIQVDVPASTGYSSQFQNAAEIENRGWELTATGVPIQLNNFGWTITGAFNTWENNVTKLAPGLEVSGPAVLGQPYGVIYGTRYDRNADGEIYIDDYGYPMVSPTAGPSGNPIPDWTLGLRNTVRWHGFSLSTLLDVRKGGDVYCGTCTTMDYLGASAKTGELREMKDVVLPGVRKSDETINTTAIDYFPDLPASGVWPVNNSAVSSIYWIKYGFNGLSESWVEDASWIRLREASLGYSLPMKWLKGTRLKDVSVTFTGRNVFLFTEYRGIDPETNLSGSGNNRYAMDYFNSPNTRSYTINFQLTF